MTFKPTELYEPLKHRCEYDQQLVHVTPVNIKTDTLYLEGVDLVFFRYDAVMEGEEVEIEWCEIGITFAAGDGMYIKTTDRKVLKAFGFDFEGATDNARDALYYAER